MDHVNNSIHLARTTLGIVLAYALSGWRKNARSFNRWMIILDLSDAPYSNMVVFR